MVVAMMVLMRMIVVIVLIVMMMLVRVVVGVDRELRRRHPSPQHAIGVDMHSVQREAAERLLQRVERQPGVKERAQSHVARDAREAVEVENFHQPPDSLKLQYRVSPRITWSTTVMPISVPAAANRRVSSTSSALGV